jgi:hypothetical protein
VTYQAPTKSGRRIRRILYSEVRLVCRLAQTACTHARPVLCAGARSCLRAHTLLLQCSALECGQSESLTVQDYGEPRAAIGRQRVGSFA